MRSEAEGLTGRALIIIIFLAAASVVTVILGVVYVQHARHRKAEAQRQAMNRAVQEANVFLPR